MLKFFSDRDLSIYKDVLDKKLQKITFKIGLSCYDATVIDKFKDNKSINGVSVKLHEEEVLSTNAKMKVKELLVITVDLSCLPNADKEFRALVAAHSGLTLREKHYMITQFEECLAKHDLLVRNPKPRGHESDHGGANLAF